MPSSCRSERVVDSRLSVLIDQCELQTYSPFDWIADANAPPVASACTLAITALGWREPGRRIVKAVEASYKRRACRLLRWPKYIFGVQ